MEKSANRIIEAIKKQEKIIIYGDYDVDGITSITVLKSFLNDRGINADFYIPNRLEEGYGLNKEAIDKIKKRGCELMITVDCRYISFRRNRIQQFSWNRNDNNRSS